MRAKRLSGWWLVPLLSVASLGAAGSDLRLVDAARKADKVAVRDLLQKKVDVNAPEADGTTALHWAVQQDDLETAGLLIRAGANVKAATRYGVTPLALAATTGNAAMIEALLKAGADPNTANPEGETVFMTAARTGKVDALKMLRARGADVNAKEGWKGQTALMWAASEGHAAATKALIELGADIYTRSKTGFTPLLFAVRDGQIEATRVLLDAGVNPNETVREGAPKVDMYEGKRRVLEAAVPTSALGMAIINGHYEIAGLLLDKGADPNIPDPRGSVLHTLAFMRKPGSGSPPLPTGSLDTLELAKKLLAHGADPNSRITWKEIKFGRDAGQVTLPPNISTGRAYLSFIGATPFYLAAKHGDIALMRLLVANGADPRIPTVQNITPLMAAAGLGYWDGESPGPLTGVPETESLEALKLTLELDNDTNAVTDFGDTPIEGDGPTLLRRHPLNLEEFPETALGDMRWNGSTALHGAAMRGANLLVQFLIDHGAKLDAKNKLGWTPLMCAEGVFVANTEKDWPATVELLRKSMTEHGLNPDLYNQAAAGVKNSRVVQ